MLSKEEISKLKINVFNQCDDETIRLVAEMLKHTDQLESDKQKLIEKLEKDIKKANQIIKDGDYRYIKEVIDEAYERLKYANEILSILKED